MSLKVKSLNIIKIVLDIIMSVLLVLMFNKNVISMEFHEIGGLIVCCFFLIHNLLNWKWIVAVSKRIFNKNLYFKLRFGYIIIFLLLISVALILISGIYISKTVFAGFFSSSINWKPIHYFSSACFLILVGIHLGLNWGFVIGMFKKYIKVPTAIAKPISIILVIALVAFGAYSLVTSSFTRWITSPFPTSQLKGGFDKPMDFPTDEFNNYTRQIPSGQSNDDASSPDVNNPDNSEKSSNNIQPSDEQNGTDRIKPSDRKGSYDGKRMPPNDVKDFDKGKRFDLDGGEGFNDGEGFNKGKRPGGFNPKGSRGPQDGYGFPGKGEHGGNSSVISVILTFISIMGLFTAITYYCEKLFKRRKKVNYTLLNS